MLFYMNLTEVSPSLLVFPQFVLPNSLLVCNASSTVNLKDILFLFSAVLMQKQVNYFHVKSHPPRLYENEATVQKR